MAKKPVREPEEIDDIDNESDDDFDGDFDGDAEEDVDLDDSALLSDDDFDEEPEEVIPRPAKKRRRTIVKAKLIEGVAKSKLEKPDVAKSVWTKLQKKTTAEPLAYAISAVLVKGSMIDHKKFGVGFVIEVPSKTKAEVLFEDGIRKLVHSR